MKKIVLIGGGGHCRSVIDVLESMMAFSIAGIVDVPQNRGMLVDGYRVLGCDADLPKLVRKYQNFLITLGFVKHPNKRIKIYNILKELGAAIPVIVSPRAYVSSRARVAEGTVVMHGAIINAHAEIGPNTIINSLALIEHDAQVGAHCHISTGAVVNGGCIVGANVLIGSGSLLKQGIEIVSGSLIGMGAVVPKSLMRPAAYVGNPLKKLEERL